MCLGIGTSVSAWGVFTLLSMENGTQAHLGTKCEQSLSGKVLEREWWELKEDGWKSLVLLIPDQLKWVYCFHFCDSKIKVIWWQIHDHAKSESLLSGKLLHSLFATWMKFAFNLELLRNVQLLYCNLCPSVPRDVCHHVITLVHEMAWKKSSWKKSHFNRWLGLMVLW